MAENTAQERTEQATPKRLRDVRKKGQVPRSKELTTFVSLLAAGVGILLFGQYLIAGISETLVQGLTIDHSAAFDSSKILIELHQTILKTVSFAAPLLLLVFLSITASSFALGGWMFKLSLAVPKWERLDLIKGMGRMFSLRSLLELVKTIAKFLLVSAMVVVILSLVVGDLLQLSVMPLDRALRFAGSLALWCFFAYSLVLVVIVAMDVPFQLMEHQKKIKMTRQEVKDEYKETEGRPEVKSQVRERQREVAQRRMLSDVPKADVVITNPTHYAVALSYDMDGNGAPKVLAKGRNLIAARIREVAEENKVHIFSAPPLARALYATTEIGQEIPAKLFVAVAQVLAYVFQLRNASKSRKSRASLKRPVDLPIPEEYLNHPKTQEHD